MKIKYKLGVITTLIIFSAFLFLLSNHIKVFAQTPETSSTIAPTPSNCPISIHTNLGVVESTVNITTTGTYKVWSRIMSFSNSSDSYILQIDNNCPVKVGDLSGMTPNQWVWVDYHGGVNTNLITLNLTSGIHTVKMAGSEVGTKVDQLLFAKDLNCVPTDKGDNCITVVNPTPTPMSTGNKIKYYGVDRGSPITDTNFANLASHYVNTVIIDTFINDTNNSTSNKWANIKAMTAKYNFNYVIWPNQGGDVQGCGWETPFNSPDSSGNYIWRVKTMLDYFATDPHFLGLVTAHEPMWNVDTCKSTINDMATVKSQLKSYMQAKDPDFKVWAYLDNVIDLTHMAGYTSADIERVMDVAVTWEHCFSNQEGPCGPETNTSSALYKIKRDRQLINNAGFEGKVELVFLMQTFAMSNSYWLPTPTELQDWSCTFLNTKALDGFWYYTWGAWYNSDLFNHPTDLQPQMNTIYNQCINTSLVSPTPSIMPTNLPLPTTTPTLTPTSTPTPTTKLSTIIEAEKLSLLANSQAIWPITDTTASGGKALIFYSNAASNTSFTITHPVSSIVVTAKRNFCSGSPRVYLSIDGVNLLNTYVTSNNWIDLTKAYNLTSGTHTLSINYNNDYSKKNCDRNLILDKVTFNQ